MTRPLLLLATAASLAACQSAERTADRAADTTVDAASTAADAVDTGVDVASGAVTDAAGGVYRSARDLFTDDPEASDVALIRPTSAPGSRVQGTVRFRETGDDLMVMVSLSGLAPGRHGMHVHQNPACGMGDPDNDGQMEPGGAAGGHWDPLNTNDHGAATEDLGDKHLGDLGNITAGPDGRAEATFTIADYPSQYDVAGHAVIVHAMADDRESDPGGTSGMRMGCGVIEGRM